VAGQLRPWRRAARGLTWALLFVAGRAQAGGFELAPMGAQALGRGGALVSGIADPSALEHNPASLGLLRGTHAQVGLGLGWSQEKFRRAPLYDWSRATADLPPPAVHYEEVQQELGFTPLAGASALLSTDLGLDDWVFGLGAYAPSAFGHVRFPEEGPQRYQLVERDTVMASYSLGAAWHSGQDFGFGLTLHWIDVVRSDMSIVVDANNQSGGIYPDRSPFDVLVRIHAADRFSPSATLGAWWRPQPWLELAAAGRALAPTIESSGQIEIEGQGELLRGKSLRTGRPGGATGMVPDDSVSLSFDYAPSARIGARILNEEAGELIWDLELDLVWEGWSALEAYRVQLPGIVQVEELGIEVALREIQVERNWNDVWGARLGGQVAVLPGLWWLRGGVAWESGAVAPEYAYLDFLSFERLSLALGTSVAWRNLRLHLGYQHIFNEPLAVSESEGRMYQKRPGSGCEAPYTSDLCDPLYPGQPGAVSNAGTYLSGYDILSIALELAWEPAPQAPPAAP